MRIIAGRWRGLRLQGPPGLAFRPTADRLKESLFNILAPQLQGCSFWDLFAGSGAVGLEAASRGAAQVLLVEKDPQALRCLTINWQKCRLPAEAQVFSMTVDQALQQWAKQGWVCRVAFLDPPYEAEELYRATLETLGGRKYLQEDGLVVAEHLAKRPLAESYGFLSRYRQHKVGDSCLSFYKQTPSQ